MPDTDPAADQRRHHARFHVQADRVLAWLATAVDSMGQRFADTYGLADNDTFGRGGEDLHDRIQVLVDHAQSDGILSASGCDLTLWRVGDEGFLLTVDAPSPPRLCGLHLSVGDLLPAKTSGSVAALAVLMAVGQVANQLLDEQNRSHAADRGRAPARSPTAGHATPPSVLRPVHRPAQNRPTPPVCGPSVADPSTRRNGHRATTPAARSHPKPRAGPG